MYIQVYELCSRAVSSCYRRAAHTCGRPGQPPLSWPVVTSYPRHRRHQHSLVERWPDSPNKVTCPPSSLLIQTLVSSMTKHYVPISDLHLIPNPCLISNIFRFKLWVSPCSFYQYVYSRTFYRKCAIGSVQLSTLPERSVKFKVQLKPIQSSFFYIAYFWIYFLLLNKFLWNNIWVYFHI